MSGPLGCRHSAVWVVTGGANERAFALLKALALLQAIRVMVDLEALITVLALVNGVHLDEVVGQRLTRTVGIVVAPEPPHAG